MPALTPDVTPSAFGSRGGGRVRMPCMRKLLQPTPLPFGEMEKSHPRDLTSSTPGMLAERRMRRVWEHLGGLTA